MKYIEDCEIVDIISEENYIYITLNSEKISKEAKPGQFINIKLFNTYDPLLRRPFSIMNIKDKRLNLLVLKKGKATNMMSYLKAGDIINIIGPLGKPLIINETKKILCIAGGVGVAPFIFLANYLNKKVDLILGVKRKDLIPQIFDYSNNVNYIISTDDGSYGIKGNVIDVIKNMDIKDYAIYVCGPTPMFKALIEYFNNTSPDIEAYFLLETYMGCGFGACKGCAVEIKNSDEYKLCCIDGPSFYWKDLVI